MTSGWGVRTYAPRQGRITKGQRRALDALKPLYAVDLTGGRRPVASLFPRPFDRYVLEIGFGMGDATVALAERFPGTGFLGVEIHSPGVGKVLREIHTKGLDNLRVVQADVFLVFEQLLLPDSFDGVHIFFPDPWPKRKHHKRRMIQSPFLDILHPFMKEGAYLYITTDWEDYASQILQVCSSHPAFVNEYGGFAPRQVWRPVTKYERKGAREHHPIWEVFLFKRTSSPG
ncbi:tRNA (guanosine(46)-N7)-methyltransferase TrmB [Spirochaeta thermophila]|nr:tRNA (guanosine(46)-N7)-methyltransferase TrmB [Spirochaeta thermophila]